jgi:hypothetical protein
MASDCESLARELAALRNEISRIQTISESQVRTIAKSVVDDEKPNFVASTKAALEPGIASAVVGGVAVVTSKLQPQIDSGLTKAREALNKALSLETTVNNAQREAISATSEALRAKRDAAEATAKATRAQGTANAAETLGQGATKSAGEAKNIGNNAFDKAGNAARKAELLEAQAEAARIKLNNLEDIAKTASKESKLAQGLANAADGKATGAVTKSAQAIKTAADATTEVGVVRGLANAAGSKVDALGRGIQALEVKVGGAIARAAEAIGISKQALGAYAKLAGRVLELFNTVATIFTLIEQLFVLETLGARIDAVERSVLALGEELSRMLGTLLGLKGRIQRNEVKISSVEVIADDAKRIGEAANLKAGAAQVTAGRAYGLATSATSDAKQAQLTADGAVRNAKIANDNAKVAYDRANEATKTANTATKKANEAIGKAGEAFNKAGEAFNKAIQGLGLALLALSLYQGFKGLKGLKGDKGDRGLQGLRGEQGLPGITTVVQLPGTPGRDGKDGRPGNNGFPGRDGVDAVPYDDSGLRSLIVQQHAETRATVNATTTGLIGNLQGFVASRLSGLTVLITAIANNALVDKALSVLTFATTLHNALMLTNNLGQTLGSIINTVIGLVLPKGIDGNPIDINSILGKATTSLIQEAIGEDNYTKLSQEWALANRIYQASANVFNAITNATSALINGLELIGSHVAKIGNALKVWRVLGQKAYEWFNPNPNFHNKYFTFLNNAEAGANTIQAVVQVPVSIVDAKNQIDSANTEFKSAIKGDKNPDGTPKESGIPTEENKDKKDEVEAAKASSQPSSFDFSDLFDGED